MDFNSPLLLWLIQTAYFMTSYSLLTYYLVVASFPDENKRRDILRRFRTYSAIQLILLIVIHYIFVFREDLFMIGVALSTCYQVPLFLYLTKRTLPYSIICNSIWILFTFVIEIFAAIPILIFFPKLMGENLAMAYLILFINLIFVFLARNWIIRIGKWLHKHHYLEQMTYLTGALLIAYSTFFMNIVKLVFSNKFFLLNQFIAAIVTLLFLFILVYQIRETAKHIELENSALTLSLGKSITGNYLSSRHDIRNMLGTLSYMTEASQVSITYETSATPILSAMLRLKQEACAARQIQLLVTASQPSVPHTYTDPAQETQLETYFTVILGILLDNAMEHLTTHRELPQTITLQFDANHFELQVSNPIASKEQHHLKTAFGKGRSSKQNTLTSGFGLYNALEMAKQMERLLHFKVEDDHVVFELKAR